MTKFKKVKALLREFLPDASEADVHRAAELVIFAAMGIERTNPRPLFELIAEKEAAATAEN